MKNREVNKEAVHKELERLRELSNGVITPEQIVTAARSVTSPLHGSFTWDDTKAAHQWRLEQARHLLRVYVTILNNGQQDIKTRTYVALSNDRENVGGYRFVVDVLKDAALRAQLLDDAKRDMLLFQRKYASLVELEDVFSSMAAIMNQTIQRPTVMVD